MKAVKGGIFGVGVVNVEWRQLAMYGGNVMNVVEGQGQVELMHNEA